MCRRSLHCSPLGLSAEECAPSRDLEIPREQEPLILTIMAIFPLLAIAYWAREYLTLGSGLEGLMAQYKADKVRRNLDLSRCSCADERCQVLAGQNYEGSYSSGEEL